MADSNLSVSAWGSEMGTNGKRRSRSGEGCNHDGSAIEEGELVIA